LESTFSEALRTIIKMHHMVFGGQWILIPEPTMYERMLKAAREGANRE